MALLSSSPRPLPTHFSASSLLVRRRPITACQVCTPKQPLHHSTLLNVSEASAEDELWAAACLRVRSFSNLKPTTFGLQDHKRFLAEREFEAIKERVSGKRKGFGRVSCINATVPLLHLLSLSVSADDLRASCKFTDNGEDRVVVGTLDLNQCVSLPDEIAGSRPKDSTTDVLGCTRTGDIFPWPRSWFRSVCLKGGETRRAPTRLQKLEHCEGESAAELASRGIQSQLKSSNKVHIYCKLNSGKGKDCLNELQTARVARLRR